MLKIQSIFLLCPLFFYGCTNTHTYTHEQMKKKKAKKKLQEGEKKLYSSSSSNHTTTSVAVTVVSSIIILLHRRLLLSCTNEFMCFRLTFSYSVCLVGFFFSFLDFFFTTPQCLRKKGLACCHSFIQSFIHSLI